MTNIGVIRLVKWHKLVYSGWHLAYIFFGTVNLANINGFTLVMWPILVFSGW